MIRVDAVWLAVAAIDMRAGIDTALARVVAVFGCAQAHHAYVFSNRRGTASKFWCTMDWASGCALDDCTRVASCGRRIKARCK